MEVYRLEVEAYSNKYGDLQEKYSVYSDVYSTLENALGEGKLWLKQRMEYLYEQSEYCTKEDSLTLEDMIKDDALYYRFRITEVNPVYADGFNQIYSEKECILYHKPTHIVFNYDYLGNLQYKQLQWTLRGEHSSGQVIFRFPGDGNKEAGEKFKVGDLVKANDDENLYVVHGVPLKEDGILIGENRYFLSTIINNELCPYEEKFEYELTKYAEKIEEKSPYMLLRNIYIGKIKVSEEFIKELEDGKIILNENPSFRDKKIDNV